MQGAQARQESARGHEFLLLDGLRGVAALAVLIFHMQDWFAGGALFAHGYMAVDFFFVLSGFVIAHAYSARLGMPGGAWAFARARVIRLYPLLWLGSAAGIGIYALRARALGLPLDRWFIADCLAGLVPVPALWRPALFPVDPAVWSLFWELVVNLAFALVLYRLRSVWLVLLSVVLAALLIAKWWATGQVDYGAYRAGWLFGGVLALYGFVQGVLLWRWLRAHPPCRRLREGWLVVVVALMLTGIPAWSGAYDLALVLLVNPLVVYAAARSAPIAPRIEAWSGAMSYPLYIVHTPVLLLIGGVLTRFHLAGHAPKWLIGLGIVILLVALADGLDRWVDIPLRRWLRARIG